VEVGGVVDALVTVFGITTATDSAELFVKVISGNLAFY
jgi:hypothetical protein